jgi:transportin-3
VADVLLDVGEVLGGEALLGLLAQPLFQAAQSLPATNDWQTFEASLYCIRGISRLVPPTESAVLPQVMALLPSVPQQHPQLLYTSALTIAAYSEWLASARNVSALLPPVLTLLATALTGPEEAPSAAAVAFQHVCDTCSAHIASTSGHVDALLGVYERTLNPETRPNEPAIRLENEHVMHVIEGVCKVVNKLPADRGEQLLQSLCAPILNPLQQLVVSMQQGGAQPSAGQFVQHLDRLSEVFRCYRSPRPLADAFGRMWPLVQTLFALKGSDTRIMERLCRACKLAVRLCKLFKSVSKSFFKSKHYI